MKNSPQLPASFHPVYKQTRAAGLSDLQQNTKETLLSKSNWGFAGSKLCVKRYKINKNTWQLTVTNPKTQKIILQAEGHGDTLFAHEDNLARMVETLAQEDLTIRTDFNN